MEHRLIVTADDFGACDYIDNGIKEAVKAGVVSSVAALVNFEPRDSSHPYGAYKGSIPALKELVHDIKHSPDYKKARHVRVGLHFNFHAGTPVYPHESKIKSLLTRKKVNGKRLFKTIEQFNPDKVDIREVIKELHAQYSTFFHGMGHAPDQLSSHFPIIFMTPEFFEAVCMLAKPLKIPIRNPFLIWQTKNDQKKSDNFHVLKDTKKFFRKKSKTKHIGLKRAIKLIDTLDDTILSGWKRKNLKAMQKFEIPFADYVQCHVYGNGHNSDCVENVLNHLLAFHPQWYKKPDNQAAVTEMVVHLGTGDFNPTQVPSGIDENYFVGRQNELNRILQNSKLKRMKLHNYKTAFK